MYHILVTDADGAVVDAARRTFQLSSVHTRLDDLIENVPDRPGQKIWCFVEWLPAGMSGLEMCRRLRAHPRTKSSHITMILDSNEPTERAKAVSVGADDYIPGPLTADALVDRLKFYLGDAPMAEQTEASDILKTSFGLSVALHSQQVRWKGQLIPLRPREIRMLEVFLNHPDRLLSRAKIIALLGKDDEVADERTVDVWVGRLRRALEGHGLKDVIRTVRPLGYVFDTPQS